MTFLTSDSHFAISVFLLSKFFHVSISKYSHKLWKKVAQGDGGKVAGFTFFFFFRTMSRHFACLTCANDSNFSDYLKYKSDKVPKLLV